jgi:DNA-binding NarL/FixJ family response regulator
VKASIERSHHPLTKRQQQVHDLVLRGMHDKEIANELRIEISTVRQHLKDICLRVGVADRLGLMAIYIAKDHENGVKA